MRAAGWPEMLIPLGVAVSLSEWGGTGSGINNTAYPDKPYYHEKGATDSPEYSAGPWQINLLAHPEVSVEQAMDLNYSTKFALDLSHGGHDFTPWGAFTNGSWRNNFGGNSELAATATPNTNKALRSGLHFGSSKERTIATTPIGSVKIRPDIGLLVKIGATLLAGILIVSGTISFAKKGT